MGEDICKPCENYIKGEEQNLSQKNINEIDNDDITNISKLLLNSIKKKPSKKILRKTLNSNKNSNNINNNNINNNPNNSNNNDNLKSTMINSVSKNDDTTPVVVDEKEINKIIYKYRINLLISYFRKFKKMKEEAKQVIQMRNNLHENRNLIILEGEQDVNVDLFPEENYDYLGNMFNNKKDGFGIQYFPKIKSAYVGYFLNDKRINVCKFEDKSKSYTYQGETNNNYTGKYGIYNNYGNGVVYEGEFENNKKNGIGIEIYPDGGIYKGEFKNGLKHGIGTYYWKDGSVYEGEWKNNIIEGYGIYNFKDGSYSSGSWLSNQINGFGKFVYPWHKIIFRFL